MSILKALTTRRECITSIMNLMESSQESEKLEHKKKVEAELMLDKTDTAKTLVEKLQEIIDNIDLQICAIHNNEAEKIFKIGDLSVRLTNMSPSPQKIQMFGNSFVESNFQSVRSNKFPCKQCPKEFKSSQNLKIHKRKHTGENSVECSHCKKAFSSPCYLKTHKLIHFEIKTI